MDIEKLREYLHQSMLGNPPDDYNRGKWSGMSEMIALLADTSAWEEYNAAARKMRQSRLEFLAQE